MNRRKNRELLAAGFWLLAVSRQADKAVKLQAVKTTSRQVKKISLLNG
jgi:hypothetical protein